MLCVFLHTAYSRTGLIPKDFIFTVQPYRMIMIKKKKDEEELSLFLFYTNCFWQARILQPLLRKKCSYSATATSKSQLLLWPRTFYFGYASMANSFPHFSSFYHSPRLCRIPFPRVLDFSFLLRRPPEAETASRLAFL